MPLFLLTEKTDFPAPERAGPGGLLAAGGDLSPQRLLRAYGRGIFPWYAQGEPILWWSPDPRFVLFPDEARVPRSLNRIINKKIFNLTFDRAFDAVVSGEVLEHVEDDAAAAREFWRVLRPGGRFVGSTSNEYHWTNRVLFLVGRQFADEERELTKRMLDHESPGRVARRQVGAAGPAQ